MDSYQAIYDAVRSRITNGDVGSAIVDVARQALDTSFLQSHAQQQIYQVSFELMRPSVLYRPELSLDGNQYCALYGPNLQEGIAGFGDTAAEAMAAFDNAWVSDKAPHPTKGE